MARIKDGRLKLVVTTELAARGIDIPELSHVINFELPTDAPHYVHRCEHCYIFAFFAFLFNKMTQSFNVTGSARVIFCSFLH